MFFFLFGSCFVFFLIFLKMHILIYYFVLVFSSFALVRQFFSTMYAPTFKRSLLFICFFVLFFWLSICVIDIVNLNTLIDVHINFMLNVV